MILLSIFVIIIVIIAYQIQQFRRFRRTINVFPGRKCHPIFGDVPNLSNKPGGKYIIPTGALVHVHIYDIHRNGKIYPNRFLPENSRHRHPYAYIPFSAGPRNCIGQRFAMLELKSIVSTILRHFEMLPVDTPADIKMNMGMVLRPRDGVHIKFVPRKK